MVTPIVQMRKLRLRRVRLSGQEPADKRQSWDLSCSSLDPQVGGQHEAVPSGLGCPHHLWTDFSPVLPFHAPPALSTCPGRVAATLA